MTSGDSELLGIFLPSQLVQVIWLRLSALSGGFMRG
jgi:hypothetical protein